MPHAEHFARVVFSPSPNLSPGTSRMSIRPIEAELVTSKAVSGPKVCLEFFSKKSKILVFSSKNHDIASRRPLPYLSRSLRRPAQRHEEAYNAPIFAQNITITSVLIVLMHFGPQTQISKFWILDIVHPFLTEVDFSNNSVYIGGRGVKIPKIQSL